MSGVLEWREKVIHFFGKYEAYIVPVIKFALALATFLMIGKNIGYMEKINSLSVDLIAALLCSVLPVNAIVIFAMGLILANLYALSLEVCAVGFLLFAVIGLLYFRFAPKDGYYTVLTPVCFALRIPYIVPVSAGLLRGPFSSVSILCGTVAYYFILGVKENAVLLGKVEEEGSSATSKFVAVLNQLLGNREMYLTIAVFVLMVVLVYAIRRMAVDYAWTIAVVTAILLEFVILFAGYMAMHISVSMLWLILGNLISLLFGLLLQFLFFNLDYTRTERVQFEDDEYYYYVKAVPKLYVATPEKQIKSFGGKDRQRDGISREKLAEELEIDRELLDL